MKKRVAAEWEPAKGVLVAWPPLLPKELFCEFNKDTVMYVMVMNEEARQDGINKFREWQLDMSRIEFVSTPAPGGKSFWGNYWVRDWGPYAVFYENKEMSLLCGRFCSTPAVYIDRPTTLLEVGLDHDELVPLDKPTGPETYMTGSIAEYFGQKHSLLPFAFIGGNVITDGMDMLISSSILLEENRQMNNIEPDKYFEEVFSATGMTSYAITDIYEDFGIQHLDCIMKIVDEDTIFVARPPKDHSYYERIEKMIEDCFSKIKNYYGKNYRIVRFDTDRYQGDELAAYSNSLILNKTVYVPMFGIDCDSKAIESWRSVMPGYVVKGIKYITDDEPESKEAMIYENIGWYTGDALHCRTRAVWDPDMLYISVDKIQEAQSGEQQTVEAIIIDYSGKELKDGNPKLCWRTEGSQAWNEETMQKLCLTDRYYANIPEMPSGTTVEYYVSAENVTGNAAVRPAAAPVGFFKYCINN